MSAANQTRARAAQVVSAVTAGQSLTKIMPEHLEFIDPKNAPLLKSLVYGSLREWPRLMGILGQLLKTPLKDKDADIMSLIAMGIHQLSSMRIPDHAALSETVSATRALGKPWAKGLVNGVLRNYQRRAAMLESTLSPAESMALPEWLYERFCLDWPDHVDQLAAAARSHPPMTLRVNQTQTTREAYLDELAASQIAASPCEAAPDGIMLKAPVDVLSLPHFADGLCSVQDETAQLAGRAINPGFNDRILDACAAPGGKACHLKELAPEAFVLAADISEERLQRVKENCSRLKLDLLTTRLDATKIHEAPAEDQYDIILADVPCSATGVIRRNPDIKLLRRPGDALKFRWQQQTILKSLWPLLRPGGRLFYVTCSVLKEENDDVIAYGLEHLHNCKTITLDIPGAVETTHGYQVLPKAQGGDGLFFAGLATC
jgi:16S rRNA (cytosine967-C5)-methyltransferase